MNRHAGQTTFGLASDGVVIVAQGRAEREQLIPERSRIPSLYADPVAWLVVDAVTDAVSTCADRLEAGRDEVATILVSPFCTLFTMAAIERSVASGSVSPLRFAGASPGGAGSLVCVVFGFTGPSMTLSTDAKVGVPPARSLARAWLTRGAAQHVLVSVHEVDPAGRHQVRTTVLGRG